ncbi:MAG: ferrous iron transport protein A [Phycisphaerae bacterium]|nr:ferrous iron transport protein A [Phycisphaerae bacterium]
MKRTLNELDAGQSATVTRIAGRGAIRQRLMDMGVMRGTQVRVERRAPLGDPIQIAIKGYYLAIRSAEAQFIEIENAPNVSG